jgi:glyceraldehyde-3-phosphate dehydrogenase (NAD(P))
MNVLINGAGNIGTTLAMLLAKNKELLGIDKIYLHKNFPSPWKKIDLTFIQNSGVEICGETYTPYAEIINDVHYVFETTANGIGLKNKERYQSMSNLLGVCAQGSEKGFGIPFMSGINEDKIIGEKFVQIVSCNTHGAAALLQLLSGNNFKNISHADFVVVRRSEDIGNHERLVSANVVARHLDENVGTHHAIDVKDMLSTVDIDIPITSSDITTPSQMLHTTRFNIELKEETYQEQVLKQISESKFVSKTSKFDSNQVFELGRRYGFQGRIYSHAIVIANNIMVHGKTIKGWAFIPQEGNTLLSTIHSFLLQTNNKNEKDIMNTISSEILVKEW